MSGGGAPWRAVGKKRPVETKKKLPASTCPRGAEDSALRTGSRWTFLEWFDGPVCILHPGRSNNRIEPVCRRSEGRIHAAVRKTCPRQSRFQRNVKANADRFGFESSSLGFVSEPKCDEGKIGHDPYGGQGEL